MIKHKKYMILVFVILLFVFFTGTCSFRQMEVSKKCRNSCENRKSKVIEDICYCKHNVGWIDCNLKIKAEVNTSPRKVRPSWLGPPPPPSMPPKGWKPLIKVKKESILI